MSINAAVSVTRPSATATSEHFSKMPGSELASVGGCDLAAHEGEDARFVVTRAWSPSPPAASAETLTPWQAEASTSAVEESGVSLGDAAAPSAAAASAAAASSAAAPTVAASAAPPAVAAVAAAAAGNSDSISCSSSNSSCHPSSASCSSPASVPLRLPYGLLLPRRYG